MNADDDLQLPARYAASDEGVRSYETIETMRRL
jgi:hypothetical protein